jgi:hypothetical protein
MTVHADVASYLVDAVMITQLWTTLGNTDRPLSCQRPPQRVRQMMIDMALYGSNSRCACSSVCLRRSWASAACFNRSRATTVMV